MTELIQNFMYQTNTFKPTASDVAPSIIAFIPEAQTLLTVVQGVDFDRPAPRAACLAGAWPNPAYMF